MHEFALTLAIFAAGVAAGLVAALLGIGGGVLMVPIMTLIFGVPLRSALGASLVGAILASNAAALWPGKRRLMDVNLAWTLALASTFGATLGAATALTIAPEIVQALFALVLLYAALQLITGRRQAEAESPAGPHPSQPSRLRQAGTWLIGLFAGASSGLLGIGGGVVIVPALHLILRKPFKVSTATSNLLVGLTALTGAFTYWWRGALLPVPTLPITAGAFAGALIGSALDRRVSSRLLRRGMAALLIYSALQMGSVLVGALVGG
jgi:uncharacterized membrane protein YfcA